MKSRVVLRLPGGQADLVREGYRAESSPRWPEVGEQFYQPERTIENGKLIKTGGGLIGEVMGPTAHEPGSGAEALDLRYVVWKVRYGEHVFLNDGTDNSPCAHVGCSVSQREQLSNPECLVGHEIPPCYVYEDGDGQLMWRHFHQETPPCRASDWGRKPGDGCRLPACRDAWEAATSTGLIQ